MNKKKRTRVKGEAGGKQTTRASPRGAYQPPRLSRIDLPGLSGEALDDTQPLIAQGGQPSSNVNVTTMFPPPPTSS